MSSTVSITILFTDLVGSTALAARLGPEAADELRRVHYGLLRKAVAAAGGTEVKNVGDGLMVAFQSVSAAIGCAVAMQQTIDGHNRDADEPLGVRIGVSHGDAELDEDDYFGPPVVEAARLCAEADGGQILATELARLLAGSRGGHEFVPLGERTLKGIPDPVAVCEVAWCPLPVAPELDVPLPARLTNQTGLAFVGRARERAVLADAFKKAVAGERQVVVLGGEPGIGKSTLAAWLAREAHAQGAVALFGHCDEDLRIPYQPWAEALSHFVGALGGEPVELLGPDAEAIGKLVPALLPPGAIVTPGSDPETERYVLFGAVTRLLGRVSRVAPVVLVLDDLQWADKQTLLLLRHLVSSGEPIRAVVIGTFRESEVSTEHPLADVLAWLHREPSANRITLRGLEDTELIELLEAVAGHEMEADGVELAHQLRRETDGNPFFVGEILLHLSETGAISQQEDGRWTGTTELRESGLPVSVREVIGRRVARLGPDSSTMLAFAAVVGREFELGVLASALDRSEDAVLEALEAAQEANLVTEVTPNRFSFAHALVEHTLYDGLSATRRARAHRRVAEALEDLTEDDERAGELAHHWARATAPTDADKVVEYARRAGDVALAKLAPDEARRWYGQALELVDRRPQGNDALRCELLIGLGEAQRQTGDPVHRETLLSAARLAQRTGDRPRLVRAALTNTRGLFSAAGTVDDERVAVLEAAVAAAGTDDSTDRARLLALLANELTYAGDYPRRRALADEGLTVARRIGDDATLVEVLNNRFAALEVPETLADRLATSAEALGLAGRLGKPRLEFWAAVFREMVAMQAADIDDANRAHAIHAGVAEQLGEPVLRWTDGWLGWTRTFLAGDLSAAERVADAMFALGPETGQGDAFAIYAAQLFQIRVAQGRVDEILELVEQAAADNPGIPSFRTALAWSYCQLDRNEEAATVIAPDVADGFASFLYDTLWMIGLGNCGEIVAHLGLVEPSALLLERLGPYADQVDYPGPSSSGAIALVLGNLATCVGRRHEAERYYEQALELHDRIAAPYYLAMTHVKWGEMLTRLGGATDSERARSLLHTGLAVAEQYGYGAIARGAGRVLDR